jgi:hypothetical protein
MMALFNKDLRAWPAQELCVVFGVEFVRIVNATMWALDDGHRPPHEIQREALALLCEAPPDINARIALCSAVLADNVVICLAIVVNVADELLRRMTPGAVAWWKTVAPPPTWLSSAPISSLLALQKVLRIERLPDHTSNDPGDLQSDAVLKVQYEYHREKERLAAQLPVFDVAPIVASFYVSTDLQGERWKAWRSERPWRAREIILWLLPLFSQFDPVEAARQGYRATFDKRRAKKRGGPGDRRGEADETEEEAVKHVQYVEDDTDEKDRAPYFRTLDPVTGAEPLRNTPEDSVAEKREMDRLIGLARAKLGTKAANYFRQLAAGASQNDAARAAAVSDRMARKYETRMRALLDDKKPRA